MADILGSGPPAAARDGPRPPPAYHVGVTDLAHRYGTGSRRRRRVLVVVGGAVVLAVLATVLWSFADQADPEVRSRLIRYEVVSPREATAEITVVRATDEVVATCRLRALAADHSVVGESTHQVESGPTSAVLRVTLRTEREAVSVVSDGCTAPGQSRPR
jgi:hypothetical protein